MVITRQFLISALSIWLSGVSAAQEAKPLVVDAKYETITATVEGIDRESRIITLKNPEGNEISMEVGMELTSLDEIEKGDRVRIDYLEPVAVAIRPLDAPGAPETPGEFVVRNQRIKPSGEAVETDAIAATVEKIDTGERIAVLKRPDGNLMEVNIAPGVSGMQNVKPGDRVVVEATRSFALDIENRD